VASRTGSSGVFDKGTDFPELARGAGKVNPVTSASQVVLGSRGATRSAPAGASHPNGVPASPAEASLAALPVDRAKAVRG
jgi:hypothetical protein